MKLTKPELQEVTSDIDRLAKIFVFNKKSIKARIASTIESVDRELSTLEIEHEEQIAHMVSLKSDNDKMSKELQRGIAPVISERDALQKKLDFIGKLLAAKAPPNAKLSQFSNLLHNKFFEFANKESSLAEEAKATMIMQAIEKELAMIASFPILYKKNIIAIGGGFSSGKSRFVNSFIADKDIELPIGIEPVTAIPTYVISDSENSIRGYTYNGGIVDIPLNFYKKLSHNFIKTFTFNVKDIMPIMALGTTFNSGYFENICFIDTPGYNPAGEGYTDEDKKSSFEYIEQADIVLWLVAVDSNGTIPASDLDFLGSMDMSKKKLYLLISKADIKPPEELKEIIDEVVETLDDYGIEYCGLSAYSASKKEEYHFEKLSLVEFLSQENKPVKAENSIVDKVNLVCDMYKNAIEADIEALTLGTAELHSLELDLMESGFNFEGDSEIVSERISNMKKLYNVSTLKEYLKELSEIRNSLLQSVTDFFKPSESIAQD